MNEIQPIPPGPAMTSPFDTIRHVDEAGEYWFARELGPMVGYRLWQNTMAVLEKVKSMAVLTGGDPSDLLIDVNRLVPRGSGAKPQQIVDYRMTRRACSMFVLCADERKPEIAAGKNYFVVKAREAELRPAPIIQQITHPWVDRFHRSYKKHFQAVRHNFAPGCFTILTAKLGDLLMIEDEVTRHEFETWASDLPDGSIGLTWSKHVKDVTGEVGKAPLLLPDRKITVNVSVWPAEVYEEFCYWYEKHWVQGDKQRNYVHNKPQWKKYPVLAKESLVNNVSRVLTGRPSAAIPVKNLLALQRAGGFVKASVALPSSPQQGLNFQE